MSSKERQIIPSFLATCAAQCPLVPKIIAWVIAKTASWLYYYSYLMEKHTEPHAHAHTDIL